MRSLRICQVNELDEEDQDAGAEGNGLGEADKFGKLNECHAPTLGLQSIDSSPKRTRRYR